MKTRIIILITLCLIILSIGCGCSTSSNNQNAELTVELENGSSADNTSYMETSTEPTETTTEGTVETDEQEEKSTNENNSTEEFEPVGSVHTSSFLDFSETDFRITIPDNDKNSIPGTIVYTAKISGKNIEFASSKIIYYAFRDSGRIYRTEFYATNQEVLESNEFMSAVKTILLKLRVVDSEDEAQKIIDELYKSDSAIMINDTYYELDVSNLVVIIMH